MTKPYYQTELGTLYHGDCLEMIPHIGISDLLLTDPPYGIADKWKGGFSDKHGWGKAKEESFLRNEWDKVAPSKSDLVEILSKCRNAIIWGGNYFDLPISRCWLVWNKPERGFTLSEAELAWTSKDNVVRVFDYKRSDTGRVHPTQKPVALFSWCLMQFKDCTSVIDPYFGSGTTAVACEQLNRRWVGIEISEKYCEIAAKRIERERQQLKLFEPVVEYPKPKQEELFQS